MTFTNFVTIQDKASSGALWSGEEVYILGATIKFEGGNNTILKPKTMQLTSQTTEDTTAGDTSTSYINNYNRRKANSSYSGFKNILLTVDVVYNYDKVGNSVALKDIGTKKIFTPSKLYELILKPRTVYIKDHALITLLSAAQDSSPAIYNTYGIPCILTDWNIIPTLNGEEINMSISFREDKENA